MNQEPEIVKCGNCESTLFTEVVTFTKVSALVSNTGKAGIAPIGNAFICMNCGTDIVMSEAVKELSDSNEKKLVV